MEVKKKTLSQELMDYNEGVGVESKLTVTHVKETANLKGRPLTFQQTYQVMIGIHSDSEVIRRVLLAFNVLTHLNLREEDVVCRRAGEHLPQTFSMPKRTEYY